MPAKVPILFKDNVTKLLYKHQKDGRPASKLANRRDGFPANFRENITYPFSTYQTFVNLSWILLKWDPEQDSQSASLSEAYVRGGEFSTQRYILSTFHILQTSRPSNKLFQAVGVYFKFLTIFCHLGIRPSKICFKLAHEFIAKKANAQQIFYQTNHEDEQS